MWRLPRRTNKELPDSESPTAGGYNEDIPYGLRISGDCQRLEVDPVENRTLMLMMELLVQDFPYSSIVSDLNEKGLADARRQAMDSGSSLQHDAPPHRGRPPPVRNGRVAEGATTVFAFKSSREVS